jgi:hypothetical protein
VGCAVVSMNFCCLFKSLKNYLAEGVRFELTVPLRVRRFSRPVP